MAGTSNSNISVSSSNDSVIFRPSSCDILDLQSKSKQDRDIDKTGGMSDDDVVQLRHARSHAHLERGGGGGGGGGGNNGLLRKTEEPAKRIFDFPAEQKNNRNEAEERRREEEDEEDQPPSPTPEITAKEIDVDDLDVLKKKSVIQVRWKKV